jgi:hypothetical protein
MTPVLTEHVRGEGMKRAQMRSLAPAPKQVINSLPHLDCSLVRESEAEHCRLVSLSEKPRDAEREDAGLSRTGARQDQHRAIIPEHRLALVVVQALEI